MWVLARSFNPVSVKIQIQKVFEFDLMIVMEFADSREEVFGHRSEAQRLSLIDHPDCNSQSTSIRLFVSIEI